MARRFALIALVIGLAYLAMQVVYIERLPLVMDEFDGAYDAHQLLERIPYRDYQPYKTVLGYYLQLPPLLLTHDPWSGLIWSKMWLALINTTMIVGVTLTLATIFSPVAAILSELLIVCVSTFLERSSEIRVDMLTAWVGLISFLLVLRRRWLLAGLVAGASFLVSQKGIYYVISANAAAGAMWLFEARDRKTFRDLLVFNGGVVAAIAAYVALWSIVATPRTVVEATFLAPAGIALNNSYDLTEHWVRTLEQNPLYYGGAVVGLAMLAGARLLRRAWSTHLMVAAYGAMLFALCAWHRQPWPYFFVILIPTLMVVHTASIDVLTRTRFIHSRAALLALVVFGLAGVVYPLTFSSQIVTRNNVYQRYVVALTHSLLGRGDTYVAGSDLVYDREQAHVALRRLSEGQVNAMHAWPQQRLQTLIAEVERRRPKLEIVDYRTKRLPPELKQYMARRFDHFSASLSLYAPLVSASESTFDIWFDGEYRVEPDRGEAMIDGRLLSRGTTLFLQRGVHRNGSSNAVRLRLVPANLEARLDPAMEKMAPMFAGVYDY